MENVDKRILNLIELLKSKGTIRFNTDFCRAIGIEKSRIDKIKTGKTHFTSEHIYNIIREYKVNANWIFEISDKPFLVDIFSESPKTKAING